MKEMNVWQQAARKKLLVILPDVQALFPAASDPYTTGDDGCHGGFQPQSYTTDMRELPWDNNTIKQTLLNYGAVTIGMYWDPSNYYNDPNYTSVKNKSYDSYTYYRAKSDTGCGGSKGSCGGHVVTIAGGMIMKKTAGGTGAWIIKNSWGTGFGESGYFYISYNDASINGPVYFPGRIDYNAKSNVYCWDQLGNLSDEGYGNNTAYAIVKYTTTNTENLTKVGTWINTAGSTVDIHVYKNFDGSNLTNQLSSLTGQNCNYPGYYTFDLPASVSMSSSESFYIEIKYVTPGNNYPIPIEDYVKNYANPTIQSGVNWISSDGSSWHAVSATKDKFNLCINAYTTSCPDAFSGYFVSISKSPLRKFRSYFKP